MTIKPIAHCIRSTVLDLTTPYRAKRIHIDNRSLETRPTINLQEALGIALSKSSLDVAQKELRAMSLRSNLATFLFISPAIILFGRVTASSIPSYVWQSTFQTKGMLTLFGLSILAVCAGFTLRKVDKTRPLDPLNSIGVNRFTSLQGAGSETESSDDKFRRFLTWAREENPTLYIKETNQNSVAIPNSIWSKDLVELFILGDERHRRALVDSPAMPLSPIHILTSDWETFEKTETPRAEQIGGIISEDKLQPPDVALDEAVEIETQIVHMNENFSLRQHLKGEGTGWSPRHELCRRDDQYLRRYLTLGISEAAMRKSDLAYHRVVLFFEKNFNSLHLLNGGTTKVEKIAAEELISSLKKTLAETNSDKPTILSDIKLMTWAAFEMYLERSGLISDAELAQNFPVIRDYIDSDNI